MANYGPQHKDPDTLAEFVRTALARTITHRLTLGTENIEVITMSPQTEQKLIQSYQKTENGVMLNLEPGFFERLVMALKRVIENTVFNSGTPVLLVHPLIRSQLRKLSYA